MVFPSMRNELSGVIGMTSTYTVTGMTCGHCVSSVSEEVGVVPGVTGVQVDLATGLLTVESDGGVDDAAVVAAVREAGYDVAGVS
jgi:copper chaperone CopZ